MPVEVTHLHSSVGGVTPTEAVIYGHSGISLLVCSSEDCMVVLHIRKVQVCGPCAEPLGSFLKLTAAWAAKHHVELLVTHLNRGAKHVGGRAQQGEAG